ncbi:hypothetical protein M569_10545, partial [Genlisea aurea]
MEEPGVCLGTPNSSVEHLKKKMKKGEEKKKKKVEIVESENQEEVDATAPSTSSDLKKTSLNSMERKKLRKSLDKVRHGTSTEAEKTNIVLKNGVGDDGSSNGGHVAALPEFHIGVFKDLASHDSTIRHSAAKVLVTELWNVQDGYEKLENKDLVEDKSKLEAEKDDGLKNCAPSVRYAVRRLIRGVSSSREFARQGFSLGLSILISKVSSIKLESLLKLIVNLLEVSSSMKGQEAKDCLLGRLFAYGAIARSGKLNEEWISHQSTPLIREFTSCVIALAAKKRYLQEPAVEVLLEVIGKLPVEALVDHVVEAPGLQKWFAEATETGNPDALLLALKLQERVSIDGKCGQLLPSLYSKDNFFAADHLSNIAICLKESTFCQPRVHSIWPVLIHYLLPDGQDVNSEQGVTSVKRHKKNRKSSSIEGDTDKYLQSFFEQIIEGSLLTSSHDRKKLVFDLLLLLLPNLRVSSLRIFLSYKIVQCLMDVLSTKGSWLFKVAEHFLTQLTESVMQDDARRAEVIIALQKHSNGKFDCITRTKTVRDLMMGFKSESGCSLFIQNLMAIFIDGNHSSEEPSDQSQTTDENSETGSVEDKDAVCTSAEFEFLRSWIVESLPSVLKHSKLEKDALFRVQKEAIKFLAVQGLFASALGSEITSFDLKEKLRWPKFSIPNSLSQMCIEQLQSLLGNAQRGVDFHDAAASVADDNDLGSELMHFLSTLRSIPSVSLSRSLSKDDEEAFQKLLSMESQLSKKERNCDLSIVANRLHALRYLLIQLLLQIFLTPGECHEAASELVICCERAFDKPNLPESDKDDEPAVMDVLVDTMLSLLPQSSPPLRSSIELVFKYFCNEITDDGLLRMLRVIRKDLKPARHRNPNVEDEEEDAEDLLGVEEAEEPDESETGETADDSDDDDSGNLGAVDTVATADDKLQDALENDDENGDDDESDEGMDDDAMFRMDVYLARIFREKKNQAGPETAQSQLVLFKLRVLTILDIYLHGNPGKLSGKPQVLKVFSYLAQALTNPQTTEGSEQLGERIWRIFRKTIFKAKDYPKDRSVELSDLEPLLEKYLKLAARPFKKKKSDPAKSASRVRYEKINFFAQSSVFWILKLVDAGHFPETELLSICGVFRSVLSECFDGKKSAHLKSGFVREVFKRRPWIGHHLLGFLLEKCRSAKSQFLQCEALDLAVEVLKSSLKSPPPSTSNGDAAALVESHLEMVCRLIKHLAENMPAKASRRADVCRFCNSVFQMVGGFDLASRFVEMLGSDVCTRELNFFLVWFVARISRLFDLIVRFWKMGKKKVMIPANDVDLATVKYRNEEVEAPHLTGFGLKLFLMVLEAPIVGPLMLRNTVIPEPPMFKPEFPPQ